MNEAVVYENLDEFAKFCAQSYLKDVKVDFKIDSDTGVFYAPLNEEVSVILPAYELLSFALKFLKAKDVKQYLHFVVKDYILNTKDTTPLLHTKYSGSELAELDNYIPSYGDVINCLFGDSNLISTLIKGNLLNQVCERLFDYEIVREHFGDDKPYEELKDFLQGQNIILNTQTLEFLASEEKRVHLDLFAQISRDAFIFSDDKLIVQKNAGLSNLLEKYNALNYYNYQMSFYDKDGSLNERFDSYFPSVFYPKIDFLNTSKQRSFFAVNDESIYFFGIGKRLVPNRAVYESFMLLELNAYLLSKYGLDVKVNKELFDELRDTDDIPDVYSNGGIKTGFKCLIDGVELVKKDEFKTMLANLRTLLVLRIELMSHKPAEHTKEFNEFLRQSDDSYMGAASKVGLDFNNPAIADVLNLSAVEINFLCDRFSALSKAESDRDLVEFDPYIPYYDEFKRSL